MAVLGSCLVALHSGRPQFWQEQPPPTHTPPSFPLLGDPAGALVSFCTDPSPRAPACLMWVQSFGTPWRWKQGKVGQGSGCCWFLCSFPGPLKPVGALGFHQVFLYLLLAHPFSCILLPRSPSLSRTFFSLHPLPALYLHGHLSQSGGKSTAEYGRWR